MRHFDIKPVIGSSRTIESWTVDKLAPPSFAVSFIGLGVAMVATKASRDQKVLAESASTPEEGEKHRKLMSGYEMLSYLGFGAMLYDILNTGQTIRG